MHEVLADRLGGLSLPRKSVVRLIYRPEMTLDVYRGRKTTKQQQQQHMQEKWEPKKINLTWAAGQFCLTSCEDYDCTVRE